jgi:hypothetical protein
MNLLYVDHGCLDDSDWSGDALKAADALEFYSCVAGPNNRSFGIFSQQISETLPNAPLICVFLANFIWLFR